MKWEVDKVGINEVGVDKVGIEEVGIDEMGINHVSYFLENVGQIQLDQLPRYSFFIDIVPIWNSLPADIIRSLSPRSFKTKILALYF